MKNKKEKEEKLVVVDFEPFKNKCDYRWKEKEQNYCANYGRENREKCDATNCPLIYYLIEDIKIEIERPKPPYVV